MDDAVIKVNNVSKNFRLPHEKTTTLKSAFINVIRGKKRHTISTQHALKDISLEVKKGEFFGIVGRNGSGKSTLLKILAGIYQPTSGKVKVQGKLVPFIELGVGFNPELSGRDNIYLNGAMLGFSTKEINEMYDEIVEFAELERFMDQKMKNYSSGMQVRLAFSMAIRANADILLIDEVLAVGDEDFKRKCFDYFRQLKRSGTTVVFVSHDMNAVREYCNRAILIDNNKLIKEGTPDEVAKLYSKLFMKEEEKVTEGQDGTKRIGDQLASIVSVTPNKQTYKASQDVTINIAIKLQANKDISTNIAVGFLVKNSSSASVLGMNTHELHYTLGTMKKGEVIEVDWEMPNVFGDGKYIIDAAVTSTDGTINHDWWEESSSFRVYRDEYSPYLITPTIKAKIIRS